VQLSYIERRASENNILLSGRAYTLPDYWLLEAKLASPGFHLFRGQEQEVSFAISGKNLLGAGGPAPWCWGGRAARSDPSARAVNLTASAG
jgi:hypothetical protein